MTPSIWLGSQYRASDPDFSTMPRGAFVIADGYLPKRKSAGRMRCAIVAWRSAEEARWSTTAWVRHRDTPCKAASMKRQHCLGYADSIANENHFQLLCLEELLEEMDFFLVG